MERKIIEAEVSVTEFDYNTFGAITNNQIKQAKQEENGYKFRWLIPAMVFSAFELEALCNGFGSVLFPKWWEEYEQLKIKAKVILISEKYGIDVDFGTQPWQTINELIKFRNDLAHAKPRTITEKQKLIEMENGKLLGTKYPKNENKKPAAIHNYSIEKAEQFSEAVEQVRMMWLHNALHKKLPNPQFGIVKRKIEDE